MTSVVARAGVSLIALVAFAGCSSSSKTATEPSTTGHAVEAAPTSDSSGLCHAMRDASKAASAVFYANSTLSTFPTTFTDMTTDEPPELEAPAGAVVTATSITGEGWTLTVTGGGATAPTFTCG